MSGTITMGATVMSARPVVATVLEQILAALPAAERRYHAESGEMSVVLPGGSGRPAQIPWLEIDDYDWDIYARLDAETGNPLSIVIAPFNAWLAAQEGKPLPSLDAPIDHTAARTHLERVRRASQELATA